MFLVALHCIGKRQWLSFFLAWNFETVFTKTYVIDCDVLFCYAVIYLRHTIKVNNNIKLELRPVERGIFPIAESVMTDSVIFQCACVKLPNFYFRSWVWWSERSRWSTCSIMPNFMAISQTVADIWRFFNLSRCQLLPSWIFKFSKF